MLCIYLGELEYFQRQRLLPLLILLIKSSRQGGPVGFASTVPAV